MQNKLILKFGVALGGGILFWALFGMVFVVYGFFMPGTKDFNQYVFLVVFPTLYLTISNLILAKMFKDKGLKALLQNLFYIVITTALALGLVIGTFNLIGIVLGR